MKKNIKNLYSAIEVMDVPACIVIKDHSIQGNKAFSKSCIPNHENIINKLVNNMIQQPVQILFDRIGDDEYEIITINIAKKLTNSGSAICVFNKKLPGSWNIVNAGNAVDYQAHEIKTQLSTLMLAIKNFEYIASQQSLPPALIREMNEFTSTSFKSINRVKKLSEELITLFTDKDVKNDEIFIEELIQWIRAQAHDSCSNLTVLQSETDRSILLVNKRTLFISLELTMHLLSQNAEGIIFNKRKEESDTVFDFRLTGYQGPDLNYLCGNSDKFHVELLMIKQLFSINNIGCRKQGSLNGEQVLSLFFNRQ